ncbi:hypothetical protein FVER53590_12998 [Fusarium verticillioides]|nr:hypothetical protein FVER53590_12998 [Fusarium verticillioides]
MSHQGVAPNARSHITYSYYPFLTIDMSGLEPDDVYYLESRNCLSVPTPDALDHFIREYFLHVHPGLPLLDEAQFWALYSGDKEPCGGPTISLFLFQAMLFASCSFVPFSTLKCLGFTSRRNARERYYRRAKLLLDICSGRDLVSNAQGALLLTYYATGRDRARSNSILLATAIQYAQGAEADQFHKRPDHDSDTTNKLKRLWWCCIVRDRILPLGVRRQLHITSINPALDHLTEQDFEKEIQGSQVYSSQTKRSLVQIFVSLCELAIPFTSVVQTVYGMGQSAADAISPMIEHRKQIEESIRFCEISLDAWYDKASIQFPTPAGIISPEKSLVLYTNLMYIYYYSARVALYQYEAFIISLTSPGVSMDDKLHQTRLQLEDATLGITDNLKELVQLKVARFLPVSIIAYAALPLVLHLLDVRLAKVPSQTARKQGRLNIYVETMKGLQNLYDGVDDVWAFIRAAIDSATSGTLDTCSTRADFISSSALCSKPSAPIQVADDWGQVSATSCDKASMEEKGNTEMEDAERDQILSSFVSAMFPLGSSTAQISFLGSWLWHLPPRLGSSAALDHAALSLAWAYFAKLYGDPIALRNAEISYLRAVKSLAAALDDVKEQLSSNVLCATVLLGHFETFVKVGYAWIRHAGGAARLMELRGSQRCYESAFEYSMFLACRGAIISEALTSGKPCILESEGWQNVPDGLIEFPLLPASPDMYHRIFGYFALVPGLQSRMTLCDRAISDESRNALLLTARQLQRDMQQWYYEYISQDNKLREPRGVSPVSEGYPFHSRYEYHDVMSATIIVACYAYLIVLDQSIALLDTCDRDGSENQGLATVICMSVDYCLHAGYCGTQTMRFALPIAHSALPRHYHQWTKKWMEKFDAIMEATMIQPLYS